MKKRFQVNRFDLLGQQEFWPIPVTIPGSAVPRLDVAWSSFHQNFLSGLPVFFQRIRFPKGAPMAEVFRDCRVERRFPRHAIVLAAAAHLALFLLPWSALPAASRKIDAFENTQLTWSGPIEDLPLLHAPRETRKPRARSVAENEPVAEGNEALHPRQRIFTDPSRPTHPRQTLVNPTAPPVAPKFLPEMPNIVQLAKASAPVRPRIEISEQTLAKLRPKTVTKAASAETPAPDAPSLEQRPTEISIAANVSSPAKPKVPIDVGSVPRVAARTHTEETAGAPDVAAASIAAGTSSITLIALSATPAAPTPVAPVPRGNLAARVAISPEGILNGAGNGSGNSGDNTSSGTNAGAGAGKSSLGISISGGSPKPNAGISGLGGRLNVPAPKSQMSLRRPDPGASIEDVPERTGPPNFAALPPGAPPEQILNSRHVYSMNVNMPNFNSATGSWIIHFSELHLSGAGPRVGTVEAPVPVHKVDPKYPQDLVLEHVEGEVILYGVIRQNGSVDSIQLVRGIDEKLDANAISAFGLWKFEPATRDGQPVDLEAIVHIPFRAPERR